jgi:UDP:flavonoid glycosyltransferase YjiC (YdhE family)
VQSEIEYFRKNSASLAVSGFTLSARLSTTAIEIPLVVTHLGSWTPIALEKYGAVVSDVFKNQLTQFISAKLLDKFGTWLFRRTKSYTKIFDEVSKALGIPPCKSFFDLVMGNHTMITDVPEILGISESTVLDWCPENSNQCRPDSRLAYAGPIYARLFGGVPDDVIDFLETDKPKIYIAMNSGHLRDLQAVYHAIAQMDVVAIMVSTLHDVNWDQASNVILKSFLPSHKVMPMCDLAIIQGGQGTIQTAIASGIPLIGFPLQPEQNFNLRRISDLGAGICMALFDLRRGKLKPAIEKVLHNPGFRQRAQELRKYQASRDGAQQTAQYIHQLVAG